MQNHGKNVYPLPCTFSDIERKQGDRFSSQSNTTTEKLEEIDPIDNRGYWDSQIQFILSCLGLAVGIGNIWRFPAMAYENGGSAFLLPYITCALLFGLPMTYLEFIIGQYTNNGPSMTFRNYFPAFQGLGWAMTLISSTLCVYYTMIIAWSGIYLASIYTGNIETWGRCDNEWNSDNCSKLAEYPIDSKNISTNYSLIDSYDMVSPFEEYFEHVIISRSSGIEEVGVINWRAGISLLVMWIIIALVLIKGIKYMGKLSYITSTIPYIIISILFIRGITLDGASSGIYYYLGRPDFSKILKFKTWVAALTQMCFSINIGYGGLITLASYSKFSNNCFRDACIVIFGDTFMSVFGGVAVFSTLGHLSLKLHKPIEKVVQSGTALAFVIYPETMSKMPIPWFWTLLFFFMLLLLGVSTEIALVEVVCTSIYDQWPLTRQRKWLVVCTICTSFFALGAIMCTGSGFYWFTIYDEFSGTTAGCLIITIEVITMAYLYEKKISGYKNVQRDVAEMNGKSSKGIQMWFGPHSPYWGMNWRVISPVLAVVIMMFTLMRNKIELRIGRDVYSFPWWAELFGWFLNILPISAIPFIFLVNYHKWKREGKPIRDMFKVQSSLRSYQRIMTHETDHNKPISHSSTRSLHASSALIN